MNKNFYNIINAVSEYYKIQEKIIMNFNRQKEVVVARSVAIFLIRDLLKLSYPQIGKLLKGRDHTTIMHSYNKVFKEINLNNNQKLKKDIVNLKNIVKDLLKNEDQEDQENNENQEDNGNQKNYQSQEDNEEKINLKECSNKQIKIYDKYESIKRGLASLDPEVTQRFEEILTLWRKGLTYQVIGEKYKISRQRVQQLVKNGLLYEMIKIEKKGIKINFTEYYKNEKNKNKKIKDLLRKKSQPIKPKKNKRWSQYYDFCRICGLSSVKHKSLGYCEKCYSKSEEFKNMQKASRLRNKDHWYKNQKEYRKEYYKRPEVIKKMKKKHDQIKFGGNREKRLKKDNYCCSVCGMSLSESLKKYKRELYVVHLNDKNNHSLDNLKTFCKDCHNRRVIKIMRKKLNQNNN